MKVKKAMAAAAIILLTCKSKSSSVGVYSCRK